MLTSRLVGMDLKQVGWGRLNSVKAADGMPYAKAGAPSEEPNQQDEEPYSQALKAFYNKQRQPNMNDDWIVSICFCIVLDWSSLMSEAGTARLLYCN